MSCPYETKAKIQGGIDTLEQMMDWTHAMEKDRRDTMGSDWHTGYDMALRGFQTKLRAVIDELEDR